ncbi:unnamed protein product [Camellia sinensis]|uniref:Glutaredoxin domain-containing protein n=1 Tax=Camellia sinensis var. sinensis TaxID=542762 RepID=A0A4S4EE76_CAMSN|nr:uncharacterized protein At5g39865-like [Camellia sinensis]THG14671.1 hypothetical protein TEA_004741 [Camellia sinensis var. sinensis]
MHAFMGCSASRFTRPTQLDQPSNNNNPSSSSQYSSDSHSTPPPISRSLSLPTPLIHHLPLRKGDSNHFVSLTSSTYGSPFHNDPIHNPSSNPNLNSHCRFNRSSSPTHIARAQTRKDPKEQSSPDYVINTWELMEGLDDIEFDAVQKPNPEKPNSFQYMGCNGSAKKVCDSFDSLSSLEIVENPHSRPLWKHFSEESLLATMDSNVVSRYRQALSSKQLGCRDTMPQKIRPVVSSTKNGGDKIVVYFTSLRGIRRTYEDCCAVRMIFRGFRVCVDERDISMDSVYRKELQSVLGGKTVSLPQVFIGEKYVGGVDEVKKLNECGELAKLLEGFPVRDLGYVCRSCGDVRFVPCPNCNGSKKIFEEEEGRLRMCRDCNENGLIRCPICCS